MVQWDSENSETGHSNWSAVSVRENRAIPYRSRKGKTLAFFQLSY